MVQSRTVQSPFVHNIYVFALLCAQIEDEGLNAEDPVLEEDIPPEPEPEPEIGMLYSYSMSHIWHNTFVYTHAISAIDIDCLVLLYCIVFREP